MAESNFSTQQYGSDQFVESVGAVCFNIALHQVCLVKLIAANEYMLPKGRHNVGEHRQETAVRETLEETGLRCSLLPVTMKTRAPPKIELASADDTPRFETNITEPFMLTCRHLGQGKGLKIIWWYIAVVSGSEDPFMTLDTDQGEPQFSVSRHTFEAALHKLTYRQDREVLSTAIEIFEQTQAGVS